MMGLKCYNAATRCPIVASLTFLLSFAFAADPYDVRFETTQGPVLVRIHPDWAPQGAERVQKLVESGYYDNVTFHRVLKGFMAQFGISPDPGAAASWTKMDDDPVKQSNTRGRVSFAMAGPNSRTTQLFINTADNSNLDAMGFAPVGEVVEGMEAVDGLYHKYGEGTPRGKGPSQTRAKAEGDAYLQGFPKLDRITKATVVPSSP